MKIAHSSPAASETLVRAIHFDKGMKAPTGKKARAN
jgi:hypothetical protein